MRNQAAGMEMRRGSANERKLEEAVAIVLIGKV
jgi:hypothetical protein